MAAWDTWTWQGCATSCRTGGCCSTTCRSGSARARRSRSSAPTAPARPRCCRIITGDLAPHAGAVTRSGGLGVMRQMVGRDRSTTRPRAAAVGLARPDPGGGGGGRALGAGADGHRRRAHPDEVRRGAGRVGRRRRLRHRGDLGRRAAPPRSGLPYDRAKYRDLSTLSGGEQKRLVLEFLLDGPDEVLLLDEPDNFLDVPGKLWLEQRIRESQKTILFISHDRELLNNTATRVVTVELGAAGNTVWTHPAASRPTTRRGGTASRASRSCAGAGTRSTRSSRRWC